MKIKKIAIRYFSDRTLDWVACDEKKKVRFVMKGFADKNKVIQEAEFMAEHFKCKIEYPPAADDKKMKLNALRKLKI